MVSTFRFPLPVRSFGSLFNYRQPQTFDPAGEIVQDPLLYEDHVNPQEKEVTMSFHVHVRHHQARHPGFPSHWDLVATTKGGATLSVQEGQIDDVEVLQVAISACSIEDNFDRKKGREIADKRLSEFGNYLTIPKDAFETQLRSLTPVIGDHGLRHLWALSTLFNLGLAKPSENFEVDALDYLNHKFQIPA